MITEGSFVFKSITLRKGGTFKDANNNDINYDDAYVLKVDEISSSSEINERKFKIDKSKINLINKFKELKPYDDIIIKFNVTLYTSRVVLDIFDFDLNNN